MEVFNNKDWLGVPTPYWSDWLRGNGLQLWSVRDSMWCEVQYGWGGRVRAVIEHDSETVLTCQFASQGDEIKFTLKMASVLGGREFVRGLTIDKSYPSYFPDRVFLMGAMPRDIGLDAFITKMLGLIDPGHFNQLLDMTTWRSVTLSEFLRRVYCYVKGVEWAERVGKSRQRLRTSNNGINPNYPLTRRLRNRLRYHPPERLGKARYSLTEPRFKIDANQREHGPRNPIDKTVWYRYSTET